jgi:hypothetical protein
MHPVRRDMPVVLTPESSGCVEAGGRRVGSHGNQAASSDKTAWTPAQGAALTARRAAGVIDLNG